MGLIYKKIIPVVSIVGIILFALFSVLSIQKKIEATQGYPENIEKTGTLKEINLIAKETEVTIADRALKVWSYNGQVPGPEIYINKGDTLKINFTNELPQDTTIHFHGIRVPNAMDGVPGVTQDAIKPGDTFVYEFTPKDAGTFWYHPHVRGSEQVERGLYGIIVVKDPTEPSFDQDKVIVLDDWRLDQTGQINPVFNSGHDLMHDGRWGNLITVNEQTIFTLITKGGERLRLRFVNTSNARVYKLDFGELNAQGFAVDGMLAKNPFSAQGFEVAPGNRLDVDITIPQASTVRPYIIRDTFTKQPNNLIEINVEGSASTQQTFKTPQAELFPNWTSLANVKVAKEYRLNARRGGMFGIEWTINEKAYPDYDPITLKKGEFNLIRFANESYRLHPMHLHGQFFQVLARNGQRVTEPYLRDTVLVKSQETVDVGLVPLDTGVWANHCHALEHAEAGMMTVVEVK